MTVPAAPLEKAVEEARKAKRYDLESSGGYGPYREMVARLDGEWVDSAVLLRLLAALDADRGEAEAALRPFAAIGADATVAEMAALAESEPQAGHGKFGIMWRTHKDGGSIVIEARDLVIARRYFARREGEKEGKRGNEG